MIGCLRTHVRKQPIIVLYIESENELKFYNLEAWSCCSPVIWVSICQQILLLTTIFESFDITSALNQPTGHYSQNQLKILSNTSSCASVILAKILPQIGHPTASVKISVCQLLYIVTKRFFGNFSRVSTLWSACAYASCADQEEWGQGV